MKKFSLLVFCFLLTSCSVVIVYAPKDVSVCGDSGEILINGSDLEGNQLDQKSDGTFDLSIP